MPTEQPTHKPIAVKVETYDTIQQISKQLSTEKGVPVSMPHTIQLIVEAWQKEGTV